LVDRLKIVRIFADSNTLFSFHYENEEDNEYDRNIELWTNPEELLKFAKTHVKVTDYSKYVEERLEDAEQIIDLVEKLATDKTIKLEHFFEPLSEKEYSIKLLSFQKGKTKHSYRRNDLRFYAIRIDENLFVLTGGAIKVSQAMQESENTQKELDKLKKAKLYLQENGVFDNDSFFELIAQ